LLGLTQRATGAKYWPFPKGRTLLKTQDTEKREHGVHAQIKWENGQKLISRARAMPEEDREYFYSVNKYVQMAHEDYSQWVAEVDQVPTFRGLWRKTIGLSDDAALDLEIGTGNGYFFEHLAREHQKRGLVGIELKYKCLIQTVKRTHLTGHKFFRLLRYDAKYLTDIFAPQELDNVFIFFPDPWEKRAQNKHRLIGSEFLNRLYEIQKPGSILKIKTDSPSYYQWIVADLPKTKYQVVATSEDLHTSKWADQNFQTHFERLWTRKGRKTYYVQLSR
jgi:tRNA (guanine-N7-)-methyltransferase